jgi:uncharacterized protein (DUF2141 family)
MRRTVMAFVLAFCGAAAASPAVAQGAGDLNIQASGFAHARGQAVAKLFLPGDNILGPGRWRRNAPITRGVASFHFPKLAAGPYAVVVFHDENTNGEIDHGLLGPSEPIGFSGGFSLSLVSGMPSFDKLKFEFRPPSQTLEIGVR